MTKPLINANTGLLLPPNARKHSVSECVSC